MKMRVLILRQTQSNLYLYQKFLRILIVEFQVRVKEILGLKFWLKNFFVYKNSDSSCFYN